jgi:hypothetical protein
VPSSLFLGSNFHYVAVDDVGVITAGRLSPSLGVRGSLSISRVAVVVLTVVGEDEVVVSELFPRRMRYYCSYRSTDLRSGCSEVIVTGSDAIASSELMPDRAGQR